MPVFEYYDENHKLITRRRETLDASNIDRFIAKHGEEKAAIYLEALYDVYKDIDAFLNGKNRTSAHKDRRAMFDYLLKKDELFLSDKVKSIVEPFAEDGFLMNLPLSRYRKSRLEHEKRFPSSGDQCP